MPRFDRQTLLLDADDTLWENNIYFERAIAAFISFLDHHSHSAVEVRQALNQTERESIAAMGYGLSSFTHSLLTCYERLSARKATALEAEKIHSFARSIADQEIELMPGVAEHLPQLAERHRLILMTKGATFEQEDKLARSGLAQYFSAVEIVSEKHAGAYREVAARHACTPASTWMIGNSPKSDINPALAAGLHAVFLVHKDTWVLEHADLSQAPTGQQLIEIERFAQLADYF
jgi:putative hydrolase of the HAD superfamily